MSWYDGTGVYGIPSVTSGYSAMSSFGGSSGSSGMLNNSSLTYDKFDINNIDDVFEKLQSIADRNNALALQTAREQMGFQASMNAQNNKFNQIEAEKTRLWQERMSNTAHQREVQDLIKSGLNPVLSASLNGASTGSGATASSGSAPSGAHAQLDTSVVSALVNMMAATLNSATATKNTRYSSNTQLIGSLLKALF